MLNDDATGKQEQLEHLTQVNALRQAIASAISAIEKNDVAQFETHLATQETLCNRLSAREWASLLTASDAEGGGEADRSLPLEIRQAYTALAQVNRVYAALLKRAQRSFGLMVALYRGHGEGYDRSPSALPQGRTWSCEV